MGLRITGQEKGGKMREDGVSNHFQKEAKGGGGRAMAEKGGEKPLPAVVPIIHITSLFKWTARQGNRLGWGVVLGLFLVE